MQRWKPIDNAVGGRALRISSYKLDRHGLTSKGFSSNTRWKATLFHFTQQVGRLERLHAEEPRSQPEGATSSSPALDPTMQTDSCPSGNSLEVENTGNLIPEPLPEDKSNASSSTSEVPVPDSKHQQQQQPQQRQTWGVPPWGLSTTITLMVVWLVVFWFAAYTAVPAVIRICGLESLSGEPRIQALRHFLLDAFQTLSTLVILRQGLRGYHPRTLGMFSFSLTPWRQWRLPLLAGCITFPAIDWVHKQLVAWLAADDYLLNGTVEQIASASDWTAHLLWYIVLAMCAPLWEEVMFRGFLLPSMLRHLPQWGAVVLSAVIFSMVHFTIEGFLPLLLLGLVFGAVYMRTKNMWPPILLHSLWNIMLLVQIKASAPV